MCSTDDLEWKLEKPVPVYLGSSFDSYGLPENKFDYYKISFLLADKPHVFFKIFPA